MVNTASGPRDTRSAVARSAVHGALWSFMGVLLTRGLTFANSLVLAHLLTPADFGIVGIAMVVINASLLLSDLGTPDAIISNKAPFNELADTALTLNLLTTAAEFLIIAAAAPLLALFAHNSAVGPVVTILAVGLVFSGLGSVPAAFLQKSLSFRSRAIPDVVSVVLSCCTSVALALSGYGVWSLVLGYLIRSIVATVLLWLISRRRPRLAFHWSVAQELIRYGRHISLNSVIGFISQNFDYMVIGHAMTSADLGVYTMAFTIATIPSTVGQEVMSKVIFPTLVRLRHDGQALEHAVVVIFSLLWSVGVAVSMVVLLGAQTYATTILGAKWFQIVSPLQVLVAMGLVQTVLGIFPPLYKAKNRPDLNWKLNMIRLGIVAPLILLLVRYGITGVALAQAATSVLMMTMYAVVTSRLLQVSIRRLWQAAVPPLLGAAAMIVVVVLVRSTPPLQPLSGSPVGMAFVLILSTISYVGLLALLRPRQTLYAARYVAVLARARRPQPGRLGSAPDASV